MFVFVLLVGIGSVESFRTFMRYKHIQTSVTGDSTKVVSYKQNAAVKALELYTKKRERLNALYDLPQIAPVVTTTVQQSIPETLSQNATQTPAIDSELLETIESEIAPEILPKPTLTD